MTFIGYSRKIIVNLSFEVIKIDLIEDINKEKKVLNFIFVKVS